MSKEQKGKVLPFVKRSECTRWTKKRQKMQDEIIIEYLPLVKMIAKKVYYRTPPNVEFDDLVSCGIIGLMDAINKFDEGRGVLFRTYAEHRIRGTILDDLRAQDWIPRSIRSQEKMLAKSISKLELTLGREATTTEVSSALDMEVNDYYKLINKVKPARLIRLDDLYKWRQIDQKNAPKFLFKHDPNDPFLAVGHNSSRKVIFETLDTLTNNEKLIIVYYYYEGKNLKEISKVLNITESRVSQIHMRAKEKLKDRLELDIVSIDDLAA